MTRAQSWCLDNVTWQHGIAIRKTEHVNSSIENALTWQGNLGCVPNYVSRIRNNSFVCISGKQVSSKSLGMVRQISTEISSVNIFCREYSN